MLNLKFANCKTLIRKETTTCGSGTVAGSTGGKSKVRRKMALPGRWHLQGDSNEQAISATRSLAV